MVTPEASSEAKQVPTGFEPRYDLSDQEVGALCRELLHQYENRPNNQLGCYILPGDSKFSNLGRYVESSVFLDTFGNTPETMAEEYGPYESASDLIVVIDQDIEKPVGVLRTIKNSQAGLKSLVDLKKTPLGLEAAEVCEKFDINPDRCIDVGTLAILPEYRARTGNILPSLLMYRALYLRYLNNPEYDHVITIIDKDAEKNLYKLSFPFKPIDPRYFSYLDSKESKLLYGINKEFYPSVSSSQKKFQQEAESGSTSKFWYAVMLDGLAHGTHLDEMLAFAKDNHEQDNSKH